MKLEKKSKFLVEQPTNVHQFFQAICAANRLLCDTIECYFIQTNEAPFFQLRAIDLSLQFGIKIFFHRSDFVVVFLLPMSINLVQLVFQDFEFMQMVCNQTFKLFNTFVRRFCVTNGIGDDWCCTIRKIRNFLQILNFFQTNFRIITMDFPRANDRFFVMSNFFVLIEFHDFNFVSFSIENKKKWIKIRTRIFFFPIWLMYVFVKQVLWHPQA